MGKLAARRFFLLPLPCPDCPPLLTGGPTGTCASLTQLITRSLGSGTATLPPVGPEGLDWAVWADGG